MTDRARHFLHAAWTGLRGFDSLMQMSTGLAEAGEGKPQPLPVQALDHATGYLIAAAALTGLTRRLRSGEASRSRLSLARTALWLSEAGEAEAEQPFLPESEADLSPLIEPTGWGDARRLLPPVKIEGAPLFWDLPARDLGSDPPAW